MATLVTYTALQRGKVTAPADAEAGRLAALERVSEGTVELEAGQSEGTVTGLALPFTPGKVHVTMQVPAGGLSIGVVAVGAPTVDGFAWQLLNGVPDNDGYKFSYRLSA